MKEVASLMEAADFVTMCIEVAGNVVALRRKFNNLATQIKARWGCIRIELLHMPLLSAACVLMLPALKKGCPAVDSTEGSHRFVDIDKFTKKLEEIALPFCQHTVLPR